MNKIRDEIVPAVLYDENIEISILGGCLNDEDILNYCIANIENEEEFYYSQHQYIWRAISDVYEKNIPIDIISVTKRLQEIGLLEKAGGAYNIAGLIHKIRFFGRDIEHKVLYFKELGIRRFLEKRSFESIDKVHDMTLDIFNTLNELSADLLNDKILPIKKKAISFDDALLKTIREIQKANANPDKDRLLGVPTPFNKLNQVTSGWQSPHLIIVAGRPGMGKTAFAIECIKTAIKTTKKKVLFFSIEMGCSEIVLRVLSSITDTNSTRIKLGKIDDKWFVKATNETQDMMGDKLHIQDKPNITVSEMMREALRFKKSNDLGMIVVDYLQIVSPGSEKANNGTRERQVSSIAEGLKRMGKELNVPVMALAQLSRGVEKSGSNIPRLSDLRESGGIEQAADIVMFLHRPEYYGLQQFTIQSNGTEKDVSTAGLCILNIAKHRDGSLCDIPIRFNASRTSFHDDFEIFNDNRPVEITPSKPYREPISEFKKQEFTPNDDPF